MLYVVAHSPSQVQGEVGDELARNAAAAPKPESRGVRWIEDAVAAVIGKCSLLQLVRARMPPPSFTDDKTEA